MSGALLGAVLLITQPASAPPTLVAVVAEHTTFSPDSCSLYCAANLRLDVSNQLPAAGKVEYGSSQLADGDRATAWVVKRGVGEEFTFVFEPRSGPDFPVDNQKTGVDRLYILNGYSKTTAQWQDHARVRELAFAIDGTPVAIVKLLDDARPQMVDLPRTLLRPGMRFRFTICKTYPGLRFDETAVSEVRLDGYGHH